MSDNKLTRVIDGARAGNFHLKGKPPVTAALTYLFLQIINRADITVPRIMNLINTWVRDPANGEANTKKEQTSGRGNIVKDICKPRITWRAFIKLLRVLQVHKLEINMVLTKNTGKQIVIGDVWEMSVFDPHAGDDDDDDGPGSYIEDLAADLEARSRERLGSLYPDQSLAKKE